MGENASATVLFERSLTRGFRPISLALAIIALLLAAPWLAAAAPPAQPSPSLHYDEAVSGRISDSVAEQEWTFDGTAGDVILIDMRSGDGGALDPYLTLLDPDGTVILTDDDGGEGLNARIGPYPLARDGEYALVASSYNGIGGYTLEVRNLSTIPALALGKPLVGVVNADTLSDYYRIVVPAEQANTPLVRLEIHDDDLSTNPFLALYGPAGQINSTEYDESDFLDPAALLPGITYVVVVSWNSGAAGGPYELEMLPSTVGLLQDGVPVQDSLSYDVLSRQHFFVGRAGEAVRVTVSVTGPIAPAITISSADFVTTLFYNDGEYVQSVAATVTLPNDGIYAVEITDGTYLGEEGTFVLQIDRITG